MPITTPPNSAGAGPLHDGSSKPDLSIICVFNDLQVRQSCLDRSISAYLGPLNVEYIPIDNTRHAYTTAGAALNHGARLAHADAVIFVHQDVYLHSIARLGAAAAMLGAGWDMLGANGISADGQSIGRLRDRVQLIGVRADVPREVETLDEVLFLVARRQVLANPLSEHQDLAWHAYAIEYGLRIQEAGGIVGAVDLAITHNSMTINLDRLDVAHRQIGRMFPERVPINTTCGTIGSATNRLRRLLVVKQHGWRLRWLRQSLAAHHVAQRSLSRVMLGDIRVEVDQPKFTTENPLHVFNLDRFGGFIDHSDGRFDGLRFDKPVRMSVVRSVSEIVDAVAALPSVANVLVVDLDNRDLTDVTRAISDRSWLAGVHSDERWLISGPAVAVMPAPWTERPAVPLRLPSLNNRAGRPRPADDSLSRD